MGKSFLNVTQLWRFWKMRRLVSMVTAAVLVLLICAPSVYAGPDPVEVWVDRYGGAGPDRPGGSQTMTVDGGGNVYVTGYAVFSTADLIVIKYDTDGNIVWERAYDGGAIDYGKALAVDSSGNVYVTGVTDGGASGEDYLTIMYDSNGIQQWIATYNGAGNASDITNDIALDDGGNVYVTGLSTGNGTKYDYATVKYDSVGNQVEEARYNGANQHDCPQDIAVAGSYVYVTGYAQFGGSSTQDWVTIKYNTDLESESGWPAIYAGDPGSTPDWAFALAVGSEDDVYVTGRVISGGVPTTTTVKYDSDGSFNTSAQYTSYPGCAYAMTMDSADNVYITGYIFMPEANEGYVTVKYDSDLTEQWAAVYSYSDSGMESGKDIAVDDDGNAYVTGYSNAKGPSGVSRLDYATIMYDSAGNPLWAARYNGSGRDEDRATAIAVDGAGQVYVTGYSTGRKTDHDIVTIKYEGYTEPAPPGPGRGKGKPRPDLAVSKSASVSQTYTGGPVTYNITVENVGRKVAENVVVVDTYPQEVTYDGVYPPEYFTYPDDLDEGNRTVTWHIPTLDPGASVVLTLVVQAQEPSESAINEVVASCSGENNLDNNEASTSVEILPKADLGVTKYPDSDPVYEYTFVTYTILVSNSASADDAENVVVVDHLPVEASYNSSSPSGMYNSTNHRVTWNLGSIPPGGGATLNCTIWVAGIETDNILTNQVAVSSDTLDFNAANDSHTEDTDFFEADD